MLNEKYVIELDYKGDAQNISDEYVDNMIQELKDVTRKYDYKILQHGNKKAMLASLKDEEKYVRGLIKKNFTMTKNMTKDEFEKEYAEKSGMTVEELHKKGQYAKECDCEYENCKGWQMVDVKK